MTQRRLIEETFPLKKVSEDSKHEKNVRHGHISTLHIWPARRPLAACRAAIIAALLPDLGDEASRHELNKKIESITRWASVGRYRAERQAMEARITERLRYFWDIGISGPDFVWAAVGPALESYSSYDQVRRLDGSLFTVSEFLREVRRLVADFALGQLLKGHSTEGLDEWTRYYLMHRNNFGLEGAPAGECILFAQGYGLDLNDLRGPRGFLVRAGGSDLRLAKWDERTRDDPSTSSGQRLGQPHPSGALPMIDMLHRLMHLWAAGNLDQLNTYAAERGLRANELFLGRRPGHPRDGRGQVARADVVGGGGGVGARRCGFGRAETGDTPSARSVIAQDAGKGWSLCH